MGLNLSQIINKFVPIKRTDDDLRENPFQTPFGQEIVSLKESFEARLWREGRPIQASTQGTTLPGTNTNTNGVAINPSPGCELYPLYACISLDVDGMVHILYNTKYTDIGMNLDGNMYESVYVKAGTPVMRRLSGEIKITEGGSFAIQASAATAGKIYGAVYGIEVPNNA